MAAAREVTPRYLTASDHPWLAALLDEARRFAGERRGAWRARLKEPLPVPAPHDKLALAASVLERLCAPRTRSTVPPPRARAAVFVAASRARGSLPRCACLASVARELGVEVEALESSLFADLPDERRLTAPEPALGAAALGEHANLALVARLFRRADRVDVLADGNVRALVRQAKLCGLLCTVGDVEHGRGGPADTHAARERCHLELTGPFSLFRRTTVYGHALAALVPRAVWCHHVELRARCHLGPGAPRVVVVRSGDPILPAAPSRTYDSRLEERFARDFARAAPEWDVVREPEALPAKGTLVFPDFLLRHRRDPGRSWLLEVMGYWTPAYVQKKLEHLRAARLERFILCVDAERNCGDGDLPAAAHVVRFRKRVDVAAVLALVEGERR
ncbi:MAG: DUF790 family protein [Polyangiaceae bacterium]|nr:DUF790 family protein [Polyangiaceae bacterium]